MKFINFKTVEILDTVTLRFLPTKATLNYGGKHVKESLI